MAEDLASLSAWVHYLNALARSMEPFGRRADPRPYIDLARRGPDTKEDRTQ
jgi:hypothetical protein